MMGSLINVNRLATTARNSRDSSSSSLKVMPWPGYGHALVMNSTIKDAKAIFFQMSMVFFYQKPVETASMSLQGRLFR
jgi:hypothetical protein